MLPDVPQPSPNEHADDLATVLTTDVDTEILRMRCEYDPHQLDPDSVTYMLSMLSKATPLIDQKLAPVPNPSDDACDPDPANVVTKPLAVTLRTR